MPRLSRRARRAQKRIKRQRCGAFAFALSSLAGPCLRARADVVPPAGPVPKTVPNNAIFDPQRAPVIVIRIGVHRLVLVPRPSGSSTTLSAQAIENKANSTSLSSIITSSVPGAAAAPSGEIHIRGSHGQYSYFLDGAPLPDNVSGSFSDLINPKDIETLRVYTGGFPSQYGGQLAAVFDVTAKAGQVGHPAGFLQQIGQSYATYETTAQYGAAEKALSFFVSGIRSSTNFRLSPLTETPLHDAGMENVGFGKFDYQSGRNDRVTLDTGTTGATIQVPNDYARESVGQNDVQVENGTFGNLIWRHLAGSTTLRTALYAHTSQLRYDGDPTRDLLPDPGTTDTSQQTTTNENQKANYVGLRTDYTAAAGHRHTIGLGFDINAVTGTQLFHSYGVAQPDPANDQPDITDARHVSGGDRSVYLQDDWTPGRFLVNYGGRYDVHVADITTSQVSPRLNVTYTAGPKDKFHGYYDRLFQPIPVENIIKIGPSGAVNPFQPERDNFFEVGWAHQQNGTTLSLDSYYRDGKNIVDDQVFGNTQIDIPINFAKGYTRGVEVAVDGPLSRTLSFYANYARSWAQAAGPVVGGLLGAAPTSYFYDDHDQTHTASFGLAWQSHGTYANVDGEYGSGFPYGEVDDAQGNPTQLNYVRVPSHTIMNLSLGTSLGHNQLAFTVGNVLNHSYVVKQAGVFSDTQWGQGRTYGMKWTSNF